MKFPQVFCFLIFVWAASCKNLPDTPIAKPQEFDIERYRDSLKSSQRDWAKVDSIPPKSDSASIIKKEFVSGTDTIKVNIRNGKAVIDTLKNPGQKLVFVFDSDTSNRFLVKIDAKDSTANLRISQIIDAKGNADGSFGRELNYSVLEKGMHRTIISENQMAGDPWGGRFRFEVKLLW